MTQLGFLSTGIPPKEYIIQEDYDKLQVCHVREIMRQVFKPRKLFGDFRCE